MNGNEASQQDGAAVDAATPRRECGTCTLCCTVLRVDELGKLGGSDCVHQRAGVGCGIYERRPEICRAYRCLWLRGGLGEADRPDRLGAVIDVVPHGITGRLGIQEAQPGAFDASPRLQEIADLHRATMPVRVVLAGNVLDPDRPFRVLLADGEEHRVAGERIEIYRHGEKVSERRIPWIDRIARRVGIWRRRRTVRRAARNRPGSPAP